MRDFISRAVLPWLALLPLAATAQGASEDAHARAGHVPSEQGGPDLTAFFSVDATAVDSATDEPRLDDEVRAAADLLLTWQRGGFRSLAELVVATDEAELERLQVGWEIAPNTLVWIGRFHQPASYFGYLYHHGQIAQTAISKPQVDDWEDEGGLVPQHLEGVLLDTSFTTASGRRIDLSVGAGLAPVLTDGELEPMDLLEGREHTYRAAYALRGSWYPDALRDSSVSLVLMHAEVGNATSGLVVPASVAHFDQDALGLFADYAGARWRVTGGGYRIFIDDAAFWSGYLQVDCELRPALRAFGRIEGTSDAEESVFLRALDSVVTSRSMLGLRWDVSPRQALTLEVARTATTSVTGNELRLQWSAVAR